MPYTELATLAVGNKLYAEFVKAVADYNYFKSMWPDVFTCLLYTSPSPRD